MSRKAIVNIFSSYNNILMTATDLTGAETITTCNGGEVVKAGKDKGGQFAATRAAERMADALKDKEFNDNPRVICKFYSRRTMSGSSSSERTQTRCPKHEDCKVKCYDGRKHRGPCCFTSNNKRKRVDTDEGIEDLFRQRDELTRKLADLDRRILDKLQEKNSP